ncbi:DUF721 domain-containing protein [Anabaena sp. FACHB-1237]|uniref:DUF721 domain-containing protein n=1 Tax=Anabaena sp. FACHB-1237 TaxID=2692769 RepID=UPI00168179AA|nr:DciA family protein [Anabaena sp. FACHB-1237]MBD2136301.1 DUF721 domain-containing protein [Anabaena sp. FACHB-1237]
MPLNTINDILLKLQNSPQWRDKLFPRLLKSWSDIVGIHVASHTRPLFIQHDVLWVATSSAAWAQNLTFSRKHIVIQLNQKLSVSLNDIRFSTASWQYSPVTETNTPPSASLHPSYLLENETLNNQQTTKYHTAQDAFANWAKINRERSHHLPLCPQCQCPTPPGELQRWNVCSLCVTKYFK